MSLRRAITVFQEKEYKDAGGIDHILIEGVLGDNTLLKLCNISLKFKMD